MNNNQNQWGQKQPDNDYSLTLHILMNILLHQT